MDYSAQQALRYWTYRPSYPEFLVERSAKLLAIDSSTKILEVGCGPGTLTTAFGNLGCEIGQPPGASLRFSRCVVAGGTARWVPTVVQAACLRTSHTSRTRSGFAYPPEDQPPGASLRFSPCVVAGGTARWVPTVVQAACLHSSQTSRTRSGFAFAPEDEPPGASLRFSRCVVAGGTARWRVAADSVETGQVRSLPLEFAFACRGTKKGAILDLPLFFVPKTLARLTASSQAAA